MRSRIDLERRPLGVANTEAIRKGLRAGCFVVPRYLLEQLGAPSRSSYFEDLAAVDLYDFPSHKGAVFQELDGLSDFMRSA
jgi:hypothetical protein